MGRFAAFKDKLNSAAANSVVGRYFDIKGRNTKLTQEFRAGTATFLTVAYSLAVNSAILSATGGPCISEGACEVGVPPEVQGGACLQCTSEVRTSLIAATAAMGVISNFLMGVVGNMPVALVPAMGLNAYFTFTVVGFMATGRVKYQEALTAVFLEGFIFNILSVLRIRRKLVEYIPRGILLATTAGVGLFLAFIGLQGSEGIGIISYNSATLVTLGGCPPADRVHQFTLQDTLIGRSCAANESLTCSTENFIPSDTYQCLSRGVMRSATMWLGISGAIIMVFLMARGVGGAFVYGIAFVTFISWIPSDGNAARYLQKPGDTPEELWTPAMRRFEYFKKVVAVPDISKTAVQLDFTNMGSSNFWVALITFLYVDFLDATGTLFSMANFVNLYIPGFLNKKTKQFPRQTRVFCVDGTSITIGSLMGLSPLTVAGESAAGIREGGRTGITSLTVAFYFFLALFFSPLLASIPPYATGPVLVLIGAMLMSDVLGIHWRTVQEGVPAFVTIAAMPLTYSIAYGLIGGIMTYMIINGMLFVSYLIQARFLPRSIKDDAKVDEDGTPRNVFWQAYHLTFPHALEDEELEVEDIPVPEKMVTDAAELERPSLKGKLGNLYATNTMTRASYQPEHDDEPKEGSGSGDIEKYASGPAGGEPPKGTDV